MKKILIFILLLPVFLFTNGQCLDIKTHVDEFTGDTTKVSAFEIIGKTKSSKLRAYAGKSSGIYLLYIHSLESIGCATYDSGVEILFSDGQSISFKHVTKIDCSDYAPLILIITDFYDELSTIPVAKFRVTKSAGSVTYESVNPNYFIDVLKCLDE